LPDGSLDYRDEVLARFDFVVASVHGQFEELSHKFCIHYGTSRGGGDSPMPTPTTSNPKSTASIAGHPLHPMLIPFPIAFFVFAFLCDLAFWRTGNAFWATGSLWLLGAGLIMAALAAIFGVIDFLGEPRIRALNGLVACRRQCARRTYLIIQLVYPLLSRRSCDSANWFSALTHRGLHPSLYRLEGLESGLSLSGSGC
jgi:Predicted membrane protein (DUF2231)